MLETNKQFNLLEAVCRMCHEKYDTPHREGCPQARYKPNPDYRRKILVKYEDVETSDLQLIGSDEQGINNKPKN